MYHKGMGVARNEDEAEKWYKIAVKRGSYKAMLNLGVLYIEQGLSSKAIELYSESLNILINKKKSAPDIDMMKNNLMILLNQDDEQLAFCHIASSYIDYIKKEEKSLCNSSNLNGMIRELPELKLDKGYLLDDYRERNCDNSTLNLYVRPFGTGRPSDEEFGKIRKNIANQFWFEKLLNGFKKGEKKEYIIPKLNPFDYITLPCTKTAIWEAYLLQQSWHIIGMRWHGYYEHRIFINSPKDIAKIDELDSKEIKQQIYKIWDSSLYPCITIRDSKACIKHCWFDKWKGLVQITCNVTYNPKINRISKFEFEDEKVLVKYNCGYMF